MINFYFYWSDLNMRVDLVVVHFACVSDQFDCTSPWLMVDLCNALCVNPSNIKVVSVVHSTNNLGLNFHELKLSTANRLRPVVAFQKCKGVGVLFVQSLPASISGPKGNTRESS